ncbi:MAG TPA: nucleotidyltransferase domain-containing protein [Streptosporangiaceae bacterium]|nr:nucleotidyltransferase domain-containing protein [Streptosporangiaceae bacterium]
MADPDEGVAADGTIRTGAHRERVPATFEPVLTEAVAMLGESGASLYVYGSVANGSARPGSSDVDLLSIDLADTASLGRRLSARYVDRCRGVEVVGLTSAGLAGDSDAAYGDRVFLRHYCVHLAGPDPSAALPAYPADVRAARGFNGDLGQFLWRWRQELESGTLAPDLVGVRAARKTLLAVAGLVSAHDHTWTTSRSRGARRWSELEPGLAAQLALLVSWADREREPSREEVERALADDGIVPIIVARFASMIGLWTQPA